MNFMTKGKRYDTSPRADIYFQCANAKRKASTCGHKALWPYHAVEYFVTEGISDIDFAALFPAVIDSGREVVDKLMTAQDAASGEFGEVAEKLKNVAGLLVARPDNPALLDQLDILTERETALLETGERLASELVNARHQLATMRQSFETQDELLEQWRSEGHDEALRAKLNRSLTSNFDRFEFHPSEDSRSSSYIRHFFKSGERSWTLAMERAEGGRRGRYVGSATPFSRDGDDWSMELGGAGQMWFPPESELDHE
jgi:hypothetical protein